MPKSLVRVRPAGTLPWLGFSRAQPNRWFSRASIVESMHWMVLHRPVELAAFTRSWLACSEVSNCAAKRKCVTLAAMRRVQAILVIVALLATPLALLARGNDSGMADCNGMCCLPRGGHHHSPARSTAPASHDQDMACHHGAVGHMMECSMRSGQQRMDYGLIAPFPPAQTSVVASINSPRVSRLRNLQFPSDSLAAGFLAGPFQPPRS